MASITITVPDNVNQRVLDGFCTQHGWTPSNPLTKGQFIKSKIIEFVKSSVKAAEAVSAANSARVNAENNVESGITIT